MRGLGGGHLRHPAQRLQRLPEPRGVRQKDLPQARVRRVRLLQETDQTRQTARLQRQHGAAELAKFSMINPAQNP